MDIVTAAGAAVVVDVFVRTWRDVADDMARRRALASFIRTLAAVLWPWVLTRLVVPCEDRCRSELAVPILWSSVMFALDSFVLHHSRGTEGAPASVRLDPTSMTGLTFGLCSLVGSKPGGRYAHLFMYAILGCLLVVLPSHNLEKGCLEEQVFESVQKAALIYCIGILITAESLTHSLHVSI
jgi:hypothetical protein